MQQNGVVPAQDGQHGSSSPSPCDDIGVYKMIHAGNVVWTDRSGVGAARIRGATRSAFGLQTTSQRANSPPKDFRRGSTRDVASKVYISAGHLVGLGAS
jgi:hypothetical protein